MLAVVFRATPPYTMPDLHLVFLLLIVTGCWAAVVQSRWAMLPWSALVACSVAWLRVDQLREGRVLLTLSATHGLTEADLWVPAVVFAAATTSSAQRLVAGKQRSARHRQS